jgi:hypothetical protein
MNLPRPPRFAPESNQPPTIPVKHSILSLACAALLIPSASEGATITHFFTVPTAGLLTAGDFGDFLLPKFDSSLGTLTLIESQVQLTSIGGRARFDSNSPLVGTVVLTVGTALTSLNFPGSALDLSTAAVSNSGSIDVGVDEAPAGDPDPGGTPDYTGVDAATFSPNSNVTNTDTNDTSNAADFGPYQATGGGIFNVDYTSGGEVGALATVDGLADFEQAQWLANGYIRYTYFAIP